MIESMTYVRIVADPVGACLPRALINAATQRELDRSAFRHDLRSRELESSRPNLMRAKVLAQQMLKLCKLGHRGRVANAELVLELQKVAAVEVGDLATCDQRIAIVHRMTGYTRATTAEMSVRLASQTASEIGTYSQK